MKKTSGNSIAHNRNIPDHDTIREHIAYALMQRVGQGAGKMDVEMFAAYTGKKPGAVYSNLNGKNSLSGQDLVIAGILFGPSILNEVYSLIGFGGLREVQGETQNFFSLCSNMNGTVAELMKAMEDLNLTHIENLDQGPKLEELGRKLIEVGAAMTAAGKDGKSISLVGAPSDAKGRAG
jgi:hypothetical protein